MPSKQIITEKQKMIYANRDNGPFASLYSSLIMKVNKIDDF